MGLRARVLARVRELRRRRPVVDHAILTQEHYSAVRGSRQAGAITYFAFLSVFPVLALSFFVVGWISRVWPGADVTLVTAIKQILPGLIGPGEGQLSLSDIQDAAGAVGLLGLAGVLYSGLGWLSAMRDALEAVFELPVRRRAGFVAGKIGDLLALVVVGTVLFVAVAVSGFVRGFAEVVLDWAGLATELAVLLQAGTVLFGLAANVLLFYLLFRLLADPRIPRRSLWSGALLGAVAFEVLKVAAGLLLGVTKGQPSFQAFGIALILLVWIGYSSRIALYAAAWAYTSRAARAQRWIDPVDPVQGPRTPAVEMEERPEVRPARGSFLLGAAVASVLLHLVHLLRRKERP